MNKDAGENGNAPAGGETVSTCRIFARTESTDHHLLYVFTGGIAEIHWAHIISATSFRAQETRQNPKTMDSIHTHF